MAQWGRMASTASPMTTPTQPNRNVAPRFMRTATKPKEPDLLGFQAIRQFGGLPISHVHAHRGTGSLDATKNRATKLAGNTNTRYGMPYWYTPKFQFKTRFSDYTELVYNNTAAARSALKHAGMWIENVPGNRPNEHNFVNACIASSLCLALRDTDMTFIPPHELPFGDKYTNKFDVDYYDEKGEKVDLKPDWFFGIRFPDGRARLIILEIDRASEPEETETALEPRKTIYRSAEQYQRFIGQRMYKDYFPKINDGVLVLNYTKGPLRLQNMMTTWEKVTGPCNYAGFRTIPHSGHFFEILPIMKYLLVHPYERIDRTPVFLTNPDKQ